MLTAVVNLEEVINDNYATQRINLAYLGFTVAIESRVPGIQLCRCFAELGPDHVTVIATNHLIRWGAGRCRRVTWRSTTAQRSTLKILHKNVLHSLVIRFPAPYIVVLGRYRLPNHDMTEVRLAVICFDETGSFGRAQVPRCVPHSRKANVDFAFLLSVPTRNVYHASKLKPLDCSKLVFM
jgi:hypothetical protein